MADAGWAWSVTLAGAVLLAGVGWCWSGRWRGWIGRPGWDQLVLGWLPGTAFLLLGLGVMMLFEHDPVGSGLGAFVWLAGIVLLALGLVHVLFGVRWWGPRWYRRRIARDRQRSYRGPHAGGNGAA